MNEIIEEYLPKAELALTICIAVLLLLWITIAIRRRVKRHHRKSRKSSQDYGYMDLGPLKPAPSEIKVDGLSERPAILFLGTRIDPSSMHLSIPPKDEDKGFTLLEISWVITDLKGNIQSEQSYSIPGEDGEERTKMLRRSLGHFQKELFVCSLYICTDMGDGGEDAINMELELMDRNSLLHYRDCEYLTYLVDEYPRVPQSRMLAAVYKKIFGVGYYGKNSLDDARAMRSCFFQLRKEGQVVLKDTSNGTVNSVK